MMFSVVYFYLLIYLQTYKKKKKHPLYYVDQWLLLGGCVILQISTF